MKELIILLLLSATFCNAQNVAWSGAIGSTGTDIGHATTTDALGNTYITGIFYDNVDFDPGPSVFAMGSPIYSAMFVLKLDANGNFLWAKQVRDARGYAIAVDAGGNPCIAGTFIGTADFNPGSGVFNLTSPGYLNAFVLKLDAAGNFIWAKALTTTSWSEATSISIDGVNNVYTTGFFDGTTDFDPGSGTYNLTPSGRDIFVHKLNATGGFVWAGQMGGTAGEQGQGTVVDNNGNMYNTGFFASSICDFDPGPANYNQTGSAAWNIYIQKLDSAMNLVWVKRIGNAGYNEGNAITLDTISNTVYCTGYYSGTTDFDPGPGTSTLLSSGLQESFTLKLDTMGNFVWARKIGGNNDDEGSDIALDAMGNVITSGYFQNMADFDPAGAAAVMKTSAGLKDIFVQKLSPAGNYIWANTMGGSGNDVANSVSADLSGNIVATGFFEDTADFDPGPGFNNLISAGFEDIFIAQFGTLLLSVEVFHEEVILIYPNPTNFSIQVAAENSAIKILRIYDAIGNEIEKLNVEKLQTEINISSLPEGIYFLHIETAKGLTVKKLVKM